MTLAPDLLGGSRVVAAGAAGEILERLRGLGATGDERGEPMLLTEDDAAAWVRERAPHALVFDASAWFGSGGAQRLTDIVPHVIAKASRPEHPGKKQLAKTLMQRAEKIS